MSENTNETTGMFDTFVRPCLDCGTTVHVVDGKTRPHDCPDMTEPERVAHAWWQGYDTAKAAPSSETQVEVLGARLLATQAQQDDLRDTLAALGLSTHARPYSPHEVVRREVLPAIESLRAALARVRALAAEHAQCSGCRTPWWLTAALSEPAPSTQREHPCPGCDECQGDDRG